MDNDVITRLSQLLAKGEPCALVTVISKTGSSPRETGSMMISSPGGELVAGTIGGGKVEKKALEDARTCMEKGVSEKFRYELTLSGKGDSLGMACAGEMEVFIRVFASPKRLIIFGAGHIGLALYSFARQLGYNVTIVDERESLANKQRFPEAEVLAMLPEDAAHKLVFSGETSVVIATHGHEKDMDAVKAVYGKSAMYIGVIGSRSKSAHILRVLKEEGFDEQWLDSLYAPIGLDIGGDTPEEISLSILSQIQAVRNGKQSAHLRDGGKIHG